MSATSEGIRLDAPSWHNSTCPHDCPSACSLEVEKLASNRIGRVRGSPHNTYTDGVICAKVSKYAERTHHRDRLTQPLLRTSAKSESARFESVTWEAALKLLTNKFAQTAKEHGAESVWPYYYGGTMGLVQRDGIIRLANAFGFSGLKKTFCVQIAYDGWQAGTGALRGTDPRELADSKLIILWGCNAAATQINVMHHVSKARKLGARLVVVDPYQTPTAKIADLHIAPRPGTDGAVACALMHLLFKQDQVDREYLDKYTDRPSALEEHLEYRDPNWARAISDVPTSDIETLAQWYGNTQSSFIRLGIGFSRSRNGAANIHAVSCLPALTGAWKHKGGGALLSTGGSFHIDDTLIMGLDQSAPEARVLDMSEIGRILTGDPVALKNGPPVKAMLIQNTNPMLVAPDLGRVRQGLLREDLFVCVHEQFMTETAEMADLILPATCFVEHDDIYRSYGQTFLQVADQIIDPPGECRSNHALVCELALRLGSDYRGFKMSEKDLIAETLERSGYPAPAEFTREHFLDCAPDYEDAHFLNGFDWPDGKFRFSPDWSSIGPRGGEMPGLPDHWDVIDNTDTDHPLRLIAAPSRGYLNSTFNQSPSSIRREKKPWLQIHPNTARYYKLINGKPATIGNRKGSVTVTVKTLEHIQPDTVVVEGIWPASAFPEGIGINVLISSEPAAPNGGAVFHDTAVWVQPA